MGLVLDISRPVDVAVLVDPFPRCREIGLQVTIQLKVTGPADILRSHEKKEHGGIDRAIEETERDLLQARQLTGVQLVQDLARLLVGKRIVFLTLDFSQETEHIVRDSRIPAKRLHAGEERIPAKWDGEARQTGRRNPDAGQLGHQDVDIFHRSTQKAINYPVSDIKLC